MSIAYAIGCAIGQALFPITDEKLMAAAKKGEEKRRLKAERKNRKETKPEDLPDELRIFEFAVTKNGKAERSNSDSSVKGQ